MKANMKTFMSNLISAFIILDFEIVSFSYIEAYSDNIFVSLICVADVGYYVGQRIYGRSQLSESILVWDQIVVRFQESSEFFINYFF